MSEGTFYNWKAKFGGMTVPEAKRLKALEDEREAQESAGRADARPRRDEGAGFKKVVTPAVKREAVAHLKALFGLSERRACRIAGADRKMVRYQAQCAPDTELRGRLRTLANERRRFGYRRLFVLLRREGAPSGSTVSIGSTARRG